MRNKSTINCDAQRSESNFTTHSLEKEKRCIQ
ncbi:DUF6783 domain-containing protein [uncultured Robinsoniella sp.]